MAEMIGEYLIRRLGEEGAGHVFGVPGDYVLTFFSQMEKSPLQVVNTCDEQGAGFAADAYARLKGIGVACITYNVGGLKIANAVGQAFAERSPVIVVSGAPGTRERVHNTLLHHKVRDFDTQTRVFEQLTVGCAVLDDPETAAGEIDRVLALAKRHSRPVYIEIPRDMAAAEIMPRKPRPLPRNEHPEALPSRSPSVERIAAAKQPVILAGRAPLAVSRRFADPSTNRVSRSRPRSENRCSPIRPCLHRPLRRRDGSRAVRAYVEGDCIVLRHGDRPPRHLHGAHRLTLPSTPPATGSLSGCTRRCPHEDFVRGRGATAQACVPALRDPGTGVFAPSDRPITVDALFRQINAFLADDMVVIADPGDALFGASDLYIHDSAHFLSSAYYASLGFAVPAAGGVQAAAPKLRPLVLVGDGAFQMTGMELSTAVRFRQNPIVIVFDNDGYGNRATDAGRSLQRRAALVIRASEVLARTGLPVTTEMECGRRARVAGAIPHRCR